MPKVTLLGAGSAVFSRQILKDLLLAPGLPGGTVALVDIDADRLRLARDLAERLAAARGGRWRIEADTDRRRLLPGTDHLVSFIEVSGLETVRLDHEIPLKYGIKQVIGDTIGPGGIFKALRTGPAWLGILADAEELCPGALVLNYTNPMSILTLAGSLACGLPVVGLCHSVQGTARQLADYAGVPAAELRFRCGGINHLAWFTELSCRGEDLYPRLREAAADPALFARDPYRFEAMRHLGLFVTESSGHFSEYVPWFRKRDDLIARLDRGGYRGETGFYAANWPRWRAEADARARRLAAGEEAETWERSTEYASHIIEAVETGHPFVFHGNVLNEGLVDNLPQGGCVEVPCVADAAGIHPCRFGALPPQCAALDQAHMAVHELVVQSLLEGDREAAVHALMLDPLTAAVLSLDEIRRLFDELAAAQAPYLQWGQAT